MSIVSDKTPIELSKTNKDALGAYELRVNSKHVRVNKLEWIARVL